MTAGVLKSLLTDNPAEVLIGDLPIRSVLLVTLGANPPRYKITAGTDHDSAILALAQSQYGPGWDDLTALEQELRIRAARTVYLAKQELAEEIKLTTQRRDTAIAKLAELEAR